MQTDGNSVWMLTGKGRDLCFQSLLQFWPADVSFGPVHVVSHARAPVAAAVGTGRSLFQREREHRETGPVALENLRADFRAIAPTLQNCSLSRLHHLTRI